MEIWIYVGILVYIRIQYLLGFNKKKIGQEKHEKKCLKAKF